MPKAAPPRLVQPSAAPKTDGSQDHPLVEFDFAHTCEIGTDVLSFLAKQTWISRTHVQSGETTIARASIADRKHANLTPLLQKLQGNGQIAQQIRLRQFGDIRIQIEFAHVCGDVEYSKPPKPRKKSKKDQAKKDQAKKDQAKKDQAKKDQAKKDQPKKEPAGAKSTSEQQPDKTKTETKTQDRKAD